MLNQVFHCQWNHSTWIHCLALKSKVFKNGLPVYFKNFHLYIHRLCWNVVYSNHLNLNIQYPTMMYRLMWWRAFMKRVLTFHTQPLHMYRHQLERNKIYRTNLSLNLYYPTIRHRGMHADLPHSNSPHASSLIMKKQALPIPIKPGPLAFCLEPTLI